VGLYRFRERSELWFGVTEMALCFGTALALLNEILVPKGNDTPSRKLAVLGAVYLMSRGVTTIMKCYAEEREVQPHGATLTGQKS
jgi:hypothetical protein